MNYFYSSKFSASFAEKTSLLRYSKKTFHKKTCFSFFTFLLVLFFATSSAFAQGGTCAEIEPFCAGNQALIFPNCNNQNPSCVPAAEAGPDYGCLFTQPYPAWFYLQIDESGSLDFEIVQNTQFDANGNPIGTGLDVDFIAWGPFAQGSDLCDYSQLQSFNEIGCSYSIQPIENFSIPNAISGEIYVLLITNFNQSPGFIKLEQIGGTGSTNCGIVCNIVIDNGDLVLCDTDEVTLTTTPTGTIENYEWYFNGDLIPGANSETLVVSETGNYRVVGDSSTCNQPVEDEVSVTFMVSPDCTIDPICLEVDFEENFGTGVGRVCNLNGASTTYICNQVSQVEDGEYTISNISDGLNTGWHIGMEDHTEGDVDGRMLFVNADFNPGEFYRRTITLSPNIDYTFSAWITTMYDTDSAICGGNSVPSNIIFRIEDPVGVLIAETNTGDISNGPEPDWQQFFINFNTLNNTDIQLVLINNAPGGCGNDLAIDDITLSLENAEPAIVDPQDLTVCDENNDGVELFNLENQITEILDGQDPAIFNVSFHLTQFEAEANQNPIATPSNYQNISNPETIYVRVEKVSEPTCFSTVDFDLILNEIIEFKVNLPPLVEICSTDNFPILDATPQNVGIDLSLVTYEWTNNAGDIVSTDAIFEPTQGGIYSVFIEYPPCSQGTFSTEIIVTPIPELDLGPDQTLCDGGSFEIVPIINGDTQGITYLWSTGETTPTITVDQSGTYDLTISVGPCVTSDSIEVFISDPLVVDLGADFKICPNEEFSIVATTEISDVTYQWFINGDVIPNETDSNLNYTFETSPMGTQTITVVITAGDCMGEDSVDINPYNIGQCVISEGLSPNGDGMNDCLDLEFIADRSGAFSLEVFNRYGTSVFNQNPYVNEWCGLNNDGSELPTGTYFYVIKFSTPDAEFGDVKTGWIYLNRESN